jgi:Phage tail assembly chaperone
MFKRDPNPTFKATVPISVPGGDALPLALVFKHKTSVQLQDFLANAMGRTDADMLADMVASVDPAAKLPDESDADFLAAITTSYPAARSDILRTYLRELTESKLKN